MSIVLSFKQSKHWERNGLQFFSYKFSTFFSVGVIGTPSSWLIASGLDYKAIKDHFGVTFVDLPLAVVYEYFGKVCDEEVKEDAELFIKATKGCKECNETDVKKAYKLYVALKRLTADYRFDAFTLSCFELIETLGTTGCVALALLNDDGVLAGCEGDLQTVLTLVVAYAVTSSVGFMANPSSLDLKKSEGMFSHCTVSTKLAHSIVLRSHFESGTGVALEGEMPTGDVTVFRMGGEKALRFFCTDAIMIANASFCDCCRTQIKVKFQKENDVKYFLENSLGNHHVVLWGKHAEKLGLFLHWCGCARVEQK
jgi:L-fucose isomerase-like protein